MHVPLLKRFALALFTLALAFAPQTLRAGDWANWRGPLRDGVSPEKNLPATRIG